jgi:hypothetical protein
MCEIKTVMLCIRNIVEKKPNSVFICLALVGKDIVFRFIIEYSSLRGFDP